jgi:hypothetical protein
VFVASFVLESNAYSTDDIFLAEQQKELLFESLKIQHEVVGSLS